MIENSINRQSLPQSMGQSSLSIESTTTSTTTTTAMGVIVNPMSSTMTMSAPANGHFDQTQPSYTSLFPCTDNQDNIPRFSPEELPSYSSGVSVQRNVTKNDPLLTLNLDNDAKDGYFYQTGGVVAGSVVINPYSNMTIECVFIDLQLVESVKRSSDFPSTRVFHKTSIAHFTPPHTAYPENRLLERDMSYTFQFSLQIPETRPLEGCKSGLHYKLPSSIGSLPDSGAYSQSFGSNVDVSDGSASIYYCVRARLMLTPLRIMSQHMTHIWIMPFTSDFDSDNRRESVSSFGSISPSFSEVSSNSSISDELTSYQSSKMITNGFLRKSILGKAIIDVEKPRSFDILSHSSTVLTSKITFETSSPSLKPPLIKSINVKALLITVTSPTGAELTTSERIPLRTTIDTVQLQKLDISTKSSWEVVDRNKYQTIVQLPINIPEGDLRFVPSFKSCLSERSYELQVSVHFESGSSVEIKVPIKLVCKRRGNRGLYKVNSKGSKKSFSVCSVDENDDAPMYTLN